VIAAAAARYSTCKWIVWAEGMIPHVVHRTIQTIAHPIQP
jgi:hypothetical protein